MQRSREAVMQGPGWLAGWLAGVISFARRSRHEPVHGWPSFVMR